MVITNSIKKEISLKYDSMECTVSVTVPLNVQHINAVLTGTV